MMNPMDDYLCITILSRPNEAQPNFSGRLSQFWTYMLRTHPADFGKVYAETTSFGSHGDRLSRQYLIETSVADLLKREFEAAALDHEPIDPDDVFSKYEAAPPDWMWIEH